MPYKILLAFVFLQVFTLNLIKTVTSSDMEFAENENTTDDGGLEGYYQNKKYVKFHQNPITFIDPVRSATETLLYREVKSNNQKL